MADNWSKNGMLYRRNPLAYPTGCAPGFDPSHPAACNCVAAAIAVNGQYLDLIDGRFGTTLKATAPTVGIDGVIGPNSSFTVNTNFQYKFAGPGLNQAAWTIASIFNYTASSGAGVYQTIGVIGANGNGGFWIKDNKLDYYLNSDNVSTFSLTVGETYFVVVSGVNITATPGTPINMVAKNLRTGQVQSCIIATGGSPSIPIDDFFLFGNDGSAATGEFANCKVATAMYSPIALSMPQLLAWSADPWSFWYPRQSLNIVSLAAAASTSNFVVFSAPYDDNRTVTQMIGY